MIEAEWWDYDDADEMADAVASDVEFIIDSALDARGEWRMSNAAGIELRLGQGDPRERLALIVGPVSATLAHQLEKVAYIDLRYSNGLDRKSTRLNSSH